MPDLDPTPVPLLTPPEAPLDPARDWSLLHGDARVLRGSEGEVQRLLTVALGLFDSLLVGVVGSGELGTVVRALLSLALREAVRMRTAARHDDEPNPGDEQDPPVATPPSRLARDVQEAIERYATGLVGPGVVERATMGVEFVAGIEADYPGAVGALAGP